MRTVGINHTQMRNLPAKTAFDSYFLSVSAPYRRHSILSALLIGSAVGFRYN